MVEVPGSSPVVPTGCTSGPYGYWAFGFTLSSALLDSTCTEPLLAEEEKEWIIR
jgi:hypothetical protein